MAPYSALRALYPTSHLPPQLGGTGIIIPFVQPRKAELGVERAELIICDRSQDSGVDRSGRALSTKPR